MTRPEISLSRRDHQVYTCRRETTSGVILRTARSQGEVEMIAKRGITVTAFLLPMLFATACENTEPSPEVRLEVEAAVRGYLDALADAYSTLDINVLEGHASPNEIAHVKKLLSELLQKTGDRIEAEMVGFDIQSMSVFRSINATVRLWEVWDVNRIGAADGIEKGRTTSIQHTILQMRLIDGTWICVGRSILSQETPIPDEEPSPTEDPA
jgi:hypothetical protein